MNERTILSRATGTGLVLGLILGLSVPTTMQPLPLPSWRQLPKAAPPSQTDYQFVDAGPMDLTPFRPEEARADQQGWADRSLRLIQRDHEAALRRATEMRFADSRPLPPELMPAESAAPDPEPPQMASQPEEAPIVTLPMPEIPADEAGPAY